MALAAPACLAGKARDPYLVSPESLGSFAGSPVGLSFRTPPDPCHCDRRSGRRTDNAEREFSSRGRSLIGGALIYVGVSNLSTGVGKVGLSRAIKISRESAVDEKKGQEEDDDDSDLCPVDCVREFSSRAEFDEILHLAKEQNSLVVVDFFKTACGSCRYIEKGFMKLCKGAGNNDVSVIFLKHNVMDEYEEQSEVAESFKIRVVPLFHFYKDGKLVESFPTREKSKILEAICKHTGLELEDLPIPSGV